MIESLIYGPLPSFQIVKVNRKGDIMSDGYSEATRQTNIFVRLAYQYTVLPDSLKRANKLLEQVIHERENNSHDLGMSEVLRNSLLKILKSIRQDQEFVLQCHSELIPVVNRTVELATMAWQQGHRPSPE